MRSLYQLCQEMSAWVGKRAYFGDSRRVLGEPRMCLVFKQSRVLDYVGLILLGGRDGVEPGLPRVTGRYFYQ